MHPLLGRFLFRTGYRRWCLALLTVGLGGYPAIAVTIRGVVFSDRNADVIYNQGEAGVGNVIVSNGVDLVRTDGSGFYEISAPDAGAVFVVSPRNWKSAVTKLNRPLFYHRLVTGQPVPASVDFPLVPDEQSNTYQVLLFGGSGLHTEQAAASLARLSNERIPAGRRFAFGVLFGESATNLESDFCAITARIGLPLFAVGQEATIESDGRDASITRRELAFSPPPAAYAFNYGTVLFVVMTNLESSSNRGGAGEGQSIFLRNILKTVPREQPLVLLIDPSIILTASGKANASQRKGLVALLKGQSNSTIVAGPVTLGLHSFLGASDGWNAPQSLPVFFTPSLLPIRGGPSDADGLPMSPMGDGTPPGFGVLSVDGLDLRLDYRPVRFLPHHQIDLYAPSLMEAKRSVFAFFANVFNGHAGWRVEWRIDDLKWSPMIKTAEVPDADLELDSTLALSPENPRLAQLKRKEPLQHFWRAQYPAALAAGRHRLEVRAIDPSGQDYRSAQDITVRTEIP